ncbi:PREDICTED: uncharacterized protein LOC108561189 isoform X2 [Nicrophorus vespilloides]|uniref:Uncharacterized protein LOC108561189 isoform X2 n=1 Tax=Nicrophorus vespilloides TaxID=110193 RepID=A0ABM1MIW3_NICVS|nr:PREDICTED: uncharacterized protein LOC108561189 isoform X2 [Nicrophorus vespilloides]
MVLNTDWAQVEVIDLINDGSGLAFGIIGGRSTGVVVKTIVPGGVADRDGRLQSGDHILQIGEVNLRGLGSEQVASVLRQCGVHVRLVVARPVESTSTDYQTLGSHAPIVPTKILGDPVELDKHLNENGYSDIYFQNPSNSYSTPYIYSGQQSDLQLHTISGLVDVVRNPLPIGTVPTLPPQSLPPVTTVDLLPLDMALRDSSPETEIYTIDLMKDELGLGITVAGYVCEKEEISGIFVKSISKGSAADLTGTIKVNDRIIEVDGKSVLGSTNHQAVELLKSTGNKVNIRFERYLRGPKYEQLQQAILANELKPPSPPSPSASSLPKIPLSLHMSSLGIEPDYESRTSFDFDSAVLHDFEAPLHDPNEIFIDTVDGRLSMQFSICSQESINTKWRDKLTDEVQIVIAELTKEPTNGLGISLEGTVDVEGGQEVRPHHYIRNILPHGPVGKNGILESGDELLEVNGIQLLGLNHVEVVSILKQLPSLVVLVCARYSVPTRIIDTSQHREAFQARNILAGSLNAIMQSPERLVKAKSDTSIASSVLSESCCSRSRSLELVAGLAMWTNEPTNVILNKGDHGLGFSILDYQDPLNPQETVIVIRSLIPGGVAQTDGRLIPGDRLLAVNDIDVEHASLDRAVQVLKGAHKGQVKITVAKPLSNDSISHNSQDTEDDQTCIDDFQECIEEYQECLEVVQIAIEEDRSFNYSPCMSQVEDICASSNVIHNFTKREPEVKNRSSCDTISTNIENNNLVNHILIKSDTLPKSAEDSEKDGYETCLDESFSDEFLKNDKTPTNSLSNLVKCESMIHFAEEVELNKQKLEIELAQVGEELERITKKKESLKKKEKKIEEKKYQVAEQHDSKAFLEKGNDLFEGKQIIKIDLDICTKTNHTNSLPCLLSDSKYEHQDDGLKSYDNTHDSIREDEFFLVQYPEEIPEKCHSEPNVLERLSNTTYRYKIEEYYNDIEDCLEAFREVKLKSKEIDDDYIFNEIMLSIRSKSAPDILDNSFITLTYDPGPDRVRRKSEFLHGICNISEEDRSNFSKLIDDRTDGIESSEFSKMLEKHWGPERIVEISRKPNTSLGISIVGGKVDLHHEDNSETILGIFIKNVVPDSPAGRSGQLKTGDRILEVCGENLRNINHEKAVEAIKYANNPVTFLVQSLIGQVESNNIQSQKPVENSLQSSSHQSSLKKPQINNIDTSVPIVKENSTLIKQKSVDFNDAVDVKNEETIVADSPEKKQVERSKSYESSDESDDDEEDTRELEGRTVSKQGEEIDRASAANVKRTKEEIDADEEDEDAFGYTFNKVKKKYSNLGHSILMVQLERSVGQGLGLSLAGHKDRNCMAVFVCGINPMGAAYRTGGIQVGDEILEVNGVVLHGRCHLNASAIIKGLSGPIFKVIILRRKAAIDDIAVRPITQFPVSLAEEASEESFSNYPNVRTISIKKGNQSLGIMIIEGKHAEVGQGIFISDIQEGSSAEKAGLEIGEMILAVNKDSLLGSNYDTAANLLKRTEGLVTLVVSNPGKKPPPATTSGATTAQTTSPSSAELEKNASSQNLKPGTASPRPSTPIPEPPTDPATCPITPGRETTIEINTDNKTLGICFVGGKDTSIQNGIVISEIYKGSTAEKDGRLQSGDQIMDVNSTPLKDVTHSSASQSLKQTLPKMKLLIYRPEKLEFQTIDTELVKKPGKGLGLSVAVRKTGKGVYVKEILNGGCADVDGKIMKGDLLVSVNGQNIDECPGDEAGAVLKTATGKVTLKLHRYKPAQT